jgi:hypothetical protein
MFLDAIERDLNLPSGTFAVDPTAFDRHVLEFAKAPIGSTASHAQLHISVGYFLFDEPTIMRFVHIWLRLGTKW